MRYFDGEVGGVLMVLRAGVQHAVATNPELSDVLVTAFSAKRQLMMLKAAATLVVVLEIMPDPAKYFAFSYGRVSSSPS